MLELKNLEKNFGDLQAVKNINLVIEDGEFVSFLGPSGCGKTTLLRLVSGFEQVSTGQVLYQGRDITFFSPEKRPFGIVFQTYALFPNMSVYDNIAFGLKMRKYDKGEIDHVVGEMMKLMHITRFKDYHPAQLSGGQQQRVALARSLALKPKVILLDEPLSALDAAIRMHLRTEIKNLQKTLGITIIYVTHDQEEAMAMADRIAIMNEGEIVQLDTPENIYSRPADIFVAGFVGSMNLIEGRFENGNFKAGSIELPVKGSEGKQAIVGIRPEHLELAGEADANLVGKVEYVSHLGATARVVFRAGANDLVVDLPGSYYSRFKDFHGDIKLKVEPSQVLVYTQP